MPRGRRDARPGAQRVHVELRNAVTPSQFAIGLVKSISFGALIAGAGLACWVANDFRPAGSRIATAIEQAV